MLAQGISYSEQKEGQTEDDSNKYDTQQTVDQVVAHDLVYERICGKQEEE